MHYNGAEELEKGRAAVSKAAGRQLPELMLLRELKELKKSL